MTHRLIAYHDDPAVKDADKLFLTAFRAGVVGVDVERGLIFGSRWRRLSARGCRNAAGYIVFTLHFAGRRVQMKAHRAVWLAAHGSIPEGLIPDHVNRVRDDNRLINLRLVDAKGNAMNRRPYRGGLNPAARINAEIAERIRRSSGQGMSYRELASSFGVSKSLVAQIVRGELWS